jgi:tripartite-type tricarboxylate transporter receptor subunit TctC
MGEFLKQIARVDMLHIPFKSTQLATQEVAAGRVNLAFEGSVKPYVDAGKVRILAVTDTQRDPRFPQVPTVTEAGLPEFTYISWLGLLVPNGVPEPIVKRLNEAFNEATMDPVVKRKLADMGLNATATSPTQFTQVIREEVQRYKKMSQSISLK